MKKPAIWYRDFARTLPDKYYLRKAKDTHRTAFIWPLLGALALFVALMTIGTCARAEIVAKTIAAEACGEGRQGMTAVANTIANRARAWRKTPEQIVTQRNQYFGATASNRDRLYAQCKAVADDLAARIMNLDDLTHGAMYFLLTNESVRAWHGDQTVKIGAHTFYKEARR